MFSKLLFQKVSNHLKVVNVQLVIAVLQSPCKQQPSGSYVGNLLSSPCLERFQRAGLFMGSLFFTAVVSSTFMETSSVLHSSPRNLFNMQFSADLYCMAICYHNFLLSEFFLPDLLRFQPPEFPS